jgi:hypothetical protein
VKRTLTVVAAICFLGLVMLQVLASSFLRSGYPSAEPLPVQILRTINTSEVTYLYSAGRYGRIQDLIDAKLLDDTFIGTKAGYNYIITLDETASGYTAEAVPALAWKRDSWFSAPTPTIGGRYAYYSLPDAVVRYSTIASLAPTPAQVGKSVQ